MTLDTVPDAAHRQSPHGRRGLDHETLQRRQQRDHLRESLRSQGERHALHTRHTTDHAATAGRGVRTRWVTELRHGWQLFALAVRTVAGRSELDRREAVDFVAQERMHAWDEGFRLPY